MRRCMRFLIPLAAAGLVAPLGLTTGPAPAAGARPTSLFRRSTPRTGRPPPRSSPPVSSGSPGLEAASCASSTFCVAVGFTATSPFSTLVEQWNGSTWSARSQSTGHLGAHLPRGRVMRRALLLHGDRRNERRLGHPRRGVERDILVSRADPEPTGGRCRGTPRRELPERQLLTAVGLANQPDDGTLVEQCNGTSWSAVPSPNPRLRRSPSLHTGSTVERHVLRGRWRGEHGRGNGECHAGGAVERIRLVHRAESGQSAARPGRHRRSDLRLLRRHAVLRSSRLLRPAIGCRTDADRELERIVMDPRPSPNTSSSDNNALGSVDCFSQTACSAVGSAGNDSLAQVWNDTDWTIVDPPSQPGSVSYLNAVTCLTAWSCVTVGGYGSPTAQRTFVATASIARAATASWPRTAASSASVGRQRRTWAPWVACT